MIKQSPFFSICIPTKDRPDFVEMILIALNKQTLKNFEVIISDNSENNQTEFLVNSYKKLLNIKYFHHNPNISQRENGNFVISKAEGRYVFVNFDKTYLYPFALQKAFEKISLHNPDVLSFSIDSCSSIENKEQKTNITLDYYLEKPGFYNQRKIIKKLTSFKYCSPTIGSQITRSGYYQKAFISRKVINQIIEKHGTFFVPIAGDFIEVLLVNTYAKSSYFIGYSLGVYNDHQTKSVGRSMQSDYVCAENFCKTYDTYNYVERFSPYPSIKGSYHNILYCDFSAFYNTIGKQYSIKTYNLLMCIENDLRNQINVPSEIKHLIHNEYAKISFFQKKRFLLRAYLYKYFRPALIYNKIRILLCYFIPLKIPNIMRKHRIIAGQSLKKPEGTFEEILNFAHTHYKNIGILEL